VLSFPMRCIRIPLARSPVPIIGTLIPILGTLIPYYFRSRRLVGYHFCKRRTAPHRHRTGTAAGAVLEVRHGAHAPAAQEQVQARGARERRAVSERHSHARTQNLTEGTDSHADSLAHAITGSPARTHAHARMPPQAQQGMHEGRRRSHNLRRDRGSPPGGP
jgi:hypothetical protein